MLTRRGAVECHPALQQRELRAFCAAAGVAVVAYSPLGAGALLQHPAVVAVAQQARRTPAQVLLRWALQRNLLVIPKARLHRVSRCSRLTRLTPCRSAVGGSGARRVQRRRVGF